MTLELVVAQLGQAEHLGHICYEAFRLVQERHRLLPDWDSPAAAQQALALLISDPAVFSVVAQWDGQIVGSNFLSHHDGWGGIGPLTVDPSRQGQGIGRALMQAVLTAAEARGVTSVRLQQDAANMASLALYSSLGFAVQAVTIVMEARPFACSLKGIRTGTLADLPELESLSQQLFAVSRRNEIAAAMQHGFAVWVHEDTGGLSGYFLPGRRGHGVAQSETVMLKLIGRAARHLSPSPVRFFCPLSQPDFYRALLAVGCRAAKMMTLMARGPYAPQAPIWLPSVLG